MVTYIFIGILVTLLLLIIIVSALQQRMTEPERMYAIVTYIRGYSGRLRRFKMRGIATRMDINANADWDIYKKVMKYLNIDDYEQDTKVKIFHIFETIKEINDYRRDLILMSKYKHPINPDNKNREISYFSNRVEKSILECEAVIKIFDERFDNM